MIDLLVLLFILLCLFGLKINKGFSYQGLSFDDNLTLKGILCIVVIFSNLALVGCGGKVFPLFRLVGFLAIGGFFFLSGYGFSKKHVSAGDSYLKGFIPKRMKRVFLPLLICFIISGIACIWAGIIDFKGILNSFYYVDPFPYHSWYIWATALMYIVFYLSCKIFQKPSLRVVAVFVFCIGVAVTCRLCNVLSNFADACFCFPLGMLLAYGEKKTHEVLSKKNILLIAYLACGILVFGGANAALPFTEKFKVLDAVLHIVSALAFCFILYFTVYFFKPSNKALSVLGKYSFEIYLFHGTVYKLLYGIPLLQQKRALFAFLSVVGAVIIGVGFGKLYSLVFKKKKKTV